MAEFQGESPVTVEQKCCCVFAVDTSVSMLGARIEQLNKGLAEFAKEIRDWDVVRHKLEVVVVEFNSSVRTVLEPTLGIQLGAIPTLSAGGTTKLVDGAMEAIRIATERRQWYVETGQPSKRSWVILITDGAPDEDQDVQSLKSRIAESEQAIARGDEGFIFLPVGVDGANMSFLNHIAMLNKDLRPRELSITKFSEFFVWVTQLFAQAMATPTGQKYTPPPSDSFDSDGVSI